MIRSFVLVLALILQGATVVGPAKISGPSEVVPGTAATGIQILAGANGHTWCGTNGCTTSAIDTTGATLITAITSCETAGCTFADSKSNTWTGLTAYSGSGDFIKIFYSCGPTVGSGHTFTPTGSFAAVSIQVFSGTKTTGCLDSGSDQGVGNSASTCQIPTFTPSQSGALFIAGVGADTNIVSTAIDSSYTQTETHPTDGSAEATGAAYIVNTGSGALSPTWTMGNSNPVSCAGATFTHP